LIKGLEVDRSKEVRERASIGEADIGIRESSGCEEVACDKSFKQQKKPGVIKVLCQKIKKSVVVYRGIERFDIKTEKVVITARGKMFV
jgi:hypothetical protein